METKLKKGESGVFSPQPLIQGTGTQDRFVLFFDIMGFKDRVARSTHKKILVDLQQLSNFVSEEIKESDNFFYTMFSDSLIIFSSDTTAKTFESIVQVSNSVVKKSISLGIPIKGSIAKGKCTIRFGEKTLFFGQPIIDAYCLEESVEMYNVVLHNTVESYAVKMNVADLLFDYEVKLKGGKSHHYVLSWFSENECEAKKDLKEIRNTVSGAPRRYIDNTLDCISLFFCEKDTK